MHLVILILLPNKCEYLFAGKVSLAAFQLKSRKWNDWLTLHFGNCSNFNSINGWPFLFLPSVFDFLTAVRVPKLVWTFKYLSSLAVREACKLKFKGRASFLMNFIVGQEEEGLNAWLGWDLKFSCGFSRNSVSLSFHFIPMI